jgi:hypothetical protein
MGNKQPFALYQNPEQFPRNPAGESSAKPGDEFDYHINTSHVDPRTGSVLPTVNPLALIPRKVRSGQQVQVLFNQSYDVRGDMDYKVGYNIPESNANPRAFGALTDRQLIAALDDNDNIYPIPAK